MKKKYIKPISEFIQVEGAVSLLRISNANLNKSKTNWLQNKDKQLEINDKDAFGAPRTIGDYGVDPGGDIDIGSKVNPWGSWDE